MTASSSTHPIGRKGYLNFTKVLDEITLGVPKIRGAVQREITDRPYVKIESAETMGIVDGVY